MPESRRFVVDQTRRVLVSANTIEDAIAMAGSAFTHGQNSLGGLRREQAPKGMWGNTDGFIYVVEMCAKEKRLGER